MLHTLIPALLANVLFASAPTAVHMDELQVVDISSLDREAVDALLVLPGVEAWLEFGDRLLLVSSDPLDESLGALSHRDARGAREDLGLLTLREPGSTPSLPADAELLAGVGPFAVVLFGEARPAAATPLPWNTALVQRADRTPRSAGPPSGQLAATASLIDTAIAAVDPTSYSGKVIDLVNFGTRYTNAASFQNVTNYLAAEFTALGLTPTLEPFQIAGQTRHNVLAEIPGSTTPDDVYIICGHYDSTSQNPTVNAPGADDNASGAAAVLEMARVLSNFQFDATLRFACWAGEEQGLVGSSAHVNNLIASGALGRVKGVINMDMIAYMNTGVLDVLIEGGAASSSAMISQLVNLTPQYTSLTAFVSTSPYGSDHMPFINKGVNAVLTIEYQDWANPNYHSTSDLPSTLSLPLAIEIIKLNVAGIATLAGIQGGGTAGTITPFGQGLGGANIVTLASSSIPNIGTTMQLDVSGASGSTSLQMIISASQVSLAQLGGTVLVDFASQLWSSPFAVTAGSAQVPVSIPASPATVGLVGFAQCGGLDATQPGGFALSNGLQVVVGQ